MRTRRSSGPSGLRLVAALLAVGLLLPAGARAGAEPAARAGATGTYRNPLDIRTADGQAVTSCADPTVIRSRGAGDRRWIMYCTTDPLNDDDRTADGSYRFRLIPTFTSTDLVSWTYVGDAFTQRPDWVAEDAGLWAPDIFYADGTYYLYYTAPQTKAGGSAIGVATADSPTGPWTDAGAPVVEPQPGPCDGHRWVFDPEVIAAEGRRWIYFGSYCGGVDVRQLSDDGLTSDPATQRQVAIDNRYEGQHVVARDGWYYLLVSATDCCRGPLTGYSVFAGRSRRPDGPFLDADGVALTDARVGGTPVISMNGNRWVGTGHSDFLTDFDGQDWLLYHAIDRRNPFFAPAPGFVQRPLNKRPALLDALDWVDGWPTVRGGWWASTIPQPVPAAQPGEETRYRTRLRPETAPGRRIMLDGFPGTRLNRRWRWVREPDPGSYAVGGGQLRWQTQAADLFEDSNDASVLTRPAPRGDYVLETKVALSVPPDGCCFNYSQAGLVVYGDDERYVKLVHVSIWNTRQTEFAKEIPQRPAPEVLRYGNTVVGPPADWTWLRIVKRQRHAAERYTAYTSGDGRRWVRGGTWTHRLSAAARIGLVSMGGAGHEARFDYVRTARVRPVPRR